MRTGREVSGRVVQAPFWKVAAGQSVIGALPSGVAGGLMWLMPPLPVTPHLALFSLAHPSPHTTVFSVAKPPHFSNLDSSDANHDNRRDHSPVTPPKWYVPVPRVIYDAKEPWNAIERYLERCEMRERRHHRRLEGRIFKH